ncbi:MAG: methylated-DNA--[protein]-cysteine S-methyltransferase [Nocardioidaceae bacterium]|jgi:methylated-DNA-[protein]-cysteine S-methyltransferase|nr:methylated-DNA--[protein]-cysteine S-methyltransferase [Nocardioidaceae bacterium]
MSTSMLMKSPAGTMRLESNGQALTHAEFVAEDVLPEGLEGDPDPVLVEARDQLEAYFAGELHVFGLPLSAKGTDFQARVWAELVKIPFGETTSYGAIAARLGKPPGASRAVGLANGANPIAVVVPCHRVIGSNGKLVGYSGGLDRKRYLLGFESSKAPQAALFT